MNTPAPDAMSSIANDCARLSCARSNRLDMEGNAA